MFRGVRRPKLVLITGAGSGIGRATALRFAARGATVLATDIREDTARETVARIVERGGDGFAYPLDVTDPSQWTALGLLVFEKHGVPDVLVNNAGIGVIAGFLQHDTALWDRQLAVNWEGVVHGCRAFAPLMVSEGRGHIVNISSAASWVPAPFWPSYATSKANVRMFSECLRGELAAHGIGVSCVCPGGAATGIIGDAHLVLDTLDQTPDRKEKIQRTAGEIAEKFGPWLGFGPDVMAKGVQRAVRYNIGLLPVRPEAWVAQYLHRLAPGTVRFVTGQVRPGRLDAVGRALDVVLPDRVLDTAARISAPSKH
ncbi:SDR family NAD(P)-dependent oxidoreductase [Nocardia uniformis]|uniref:SDR family NAD(P)-dependent oxidoreductase n=1 Tax=Nocardia uniformis TaxID=53432 RepID=A0A849C0H4_9NOCA|nr:SDR family NAD(P)-dependent oxidoreductase [Nocardia uniformis]NNH70956.1 SDR family NAD(P)-dependent oxidoreductase [Nocardia uniformis]